MRLGVSAALCLVLAFCAGPVTIRPDVICIHRPRGDDLREKIEDAFEDCAPLIRITVEL